MGAMDFYYDRDPGRWRTIDRSTLLAGDVHEPVAGRTVADGLRPVIDVGGGDGGLARHLPPGGRW